ncbi:STAS domain-containing protein [Mesobacillus foraminis]|uniref:STAS domain-containing protein n=1 Tax=Mesobacillus foraminis TaxID=279826 RepID=UPI001BE8EFA7|nr:STAS domain-containing protein [Mesobacillus foraminis]MBT2756877.1 STAS domain-containing protein [Mesobacillus foraminis]
MVSNMDVKWDLEKGSLSFEGSDVVLFWISSAMRTFFDTIEEISGVESSNLVFETTGFRQGFTIGQYFEKMKNMSVAAAAEMIADTYAAAGWGKISVDELNFKEHTAKVNFKDSWEHKINVAQGKKAGGNFLPAHFAGVFTGLFRKNIWYRVIQHQIEGHEESVIEYFPSHVSVSQNIHALARKRESETIQKLETVVEEKKKELTELVHRLSSPMIPVLDGIVVVPLLGKYDEERSDVLIERTLNQLPLHKAEILLLDLTGLDHEVNSFTVSLIEKIGKSASLTGTKTILVGISGELALSITQSGINLQKFDCFQILQHGIYYALSQRGKKII